MKKAFTLIELLIVVAIIAILAAIAVPNFLEAQVRAKVSRAKNDLRTFATALESYRVDTNKYPPDGIDAWTHRGSQRDNIVWGTAHLSNFLSTPIAYMTSALVEDTFKNHNPTLVEKRYRYINYELSYKTNRPTAYPGYVAYIGDTPWLVLSNGPDQKASVGVGGGVPFYVPRVYDPTNGTVSFGDVVRSQREPEPRWGW